jgi:hypothetical protein
VSNICLRYYSFLKSYTLDYEEILNEIKTDNDMLMQWSLNFDFINCELKENIEYFPKYLNHSNIFNYHDFRPYYDYSAIYNATTMSNEQLNNAISNDEAILGIKAQVNHIPEYYDDQFKEYILQKNYLNNIKDIFFNKNLFIQNYETTEYPNIFSNLLNEEIESNIDISLKTLLMKTSFLHFYFLNVLTNNYLKLQTNLKDNLVINSGSLELLIQDISLNNYYENIIKVTLMNQFGFVNIKSNLIESLLNDTEITSSIDIVLDHFRDFVEQSDIKNEIVESSFEILNHLLSFDLVKRVFNSTGRFNFNEINQIPYELFNISNVEEYMSVINLPTIDNMDPGLSGFEKSIHDFHITTLNNVYMMKNYFYLMYLYRNKLQKFVNIIDILMNHYITNNIKIEDVYYFSNFDHLNFLFKLWYNCWICDTSNQEYYYKKDLENLQNNSKYISYINNSSFTNFVMTFEIYNQIQSFVETDQFKDDINVIQKKIFSNLRTQGLIAQDQDWCNCTFPLEVYFSFVLKKVFENIDDQSLKDYLIEQITISEYKKLDTKDEFDSFVNSFIDKNAYYIFEFYKKFITSMIAKTFSKAINLKFTVSSSYANLIVKMNVGRWKILEVGNWRNSGDMAKISTGNYVIQFEPVEGYITPKNLAIELLKGEKKSITENYVRVV